ARWGWPSARWPPPSTPPPKAGPSSSPPPPGPAACPPPCSSAPPPACCPPCAPPACHPPKHSGPSDLTEHGHRKDRAQAQVTRSNPIVRCTPAMSEHLSSPRISRRSVLRGGAAAAVAAGLPPAPRAPGRAPGAGLADVRGSHDHYGVHIEPSVAANPRHPRQLLAACQAPPTAEPRFIATYLSVDGGATWHNGALPRPPAGQAPPSDDVTVAFDSRGRGYLCATRASNTPGGRALWVWRTHDRGAWLFAAGAPRAPRGARTHHPRRR